MRQKNKQTKKIQTAQHFCRQKHIADGRNPMRNARLVQAQIYILYSHGVQKSIVLLPRDWIIACMSKCTCGPIKVATECTRQSWFSKASSTSVCAFYEWGCAWYEILLITEHFRTFYQISIYCIYKNLIPTHFFLCCWKTRKPVDSILIYNGRLGAVVEFCQLM